MRRGALTIVLMALTVAPVVAQVTNPKPLAGNPQPSYPAAARQESIEGNVEFTAIIKSDGSVESVRIARVPRQGVGFERAVLDAVKQWRFQPATQGTTAIASAYGGSIGFTLSIPGEWIYPLPSKVVWAAAQKLAGDLGLRTEKRDQDHQFLLTQFLTYRGRSLPDADALGIRLGNIPDKFQFQLYVAPGFEPARIAIGSIVQTIAISTNNRAEASVHGSDAMRMWFLSRLSKQLGVSPEQLAASAERRAEQTARLLPQGTSEVCAIRPLPVLPPKSDRLLSSPRPFHRVTPIYPKEQLEARDSEIVIFEAEVTEHGTLTGIRHKAPADAADDFRLASQLATGLWRFEPGRTDTCPARIAATFTMQFVAK